MSDQYQSNVGDAERATQNRVVKFFSEQLGYTYHGNEMNNKLDHPCMDVEMFRSWLRKQNKYKDEMIDNAISKLEHEIGQCHTHGKYACSNLYELNQKLYTWMRNGMVVDNPETGNSEVIALIDWKNPENNNYTFKEEVWFRNYQSATDWRRADIVVYINGMAIADIELKRASVSVENAVEQLQGYVENNLRSFCFNTLLVAGNETQGIKYGAIGAKSQYFMQWKEESPNQLRRNDNLDRGECAEIGIARHVANIRVAAGKNRLLQELSSLFEKSRLLDMMRWGILYDGGIKKIVRYHQYFALVAARQRLLYGKDKKGGMIWHTQGSGKTITMICLMRWILENRQDPRILIVTDREELDDMMAKILFSNKQILSVGYTRAESCDHLCKLLEEKPGMTNTKLICTLIHKFLNKRYIGDGGNDLEFVNTIQKIKALQITGNFYIFIDECHRSQAGVMHAAMKKLIPNAVLIGFTGTPIIKAEKDNISRMSEVIFGDYIHKYLYSQAVKDKVVLPLRYEARKAGLMIDDKEELDDEIKVYFDQHHSRLTEEEREKIYKWFSTKAYDSEKRLKHIVKDIQSDFKPIMTSPNKPIPRLQHGGNAMLAVKDIYRAFKYYDLFQERGFSECAVVASYDGDPKALERNDNSEEWFKAKTYHDMLDKYGQNINRYCDSKSLQKKLSDHDKFEIYIRDKFIKEPNNVKLLIVVDKLLTGFDAPSCSVLYLDKPMKDHTMFQAVCRVNRLDDNSKEWGQIVDYCFQFERLQESMNDYTGDSDEGGSVNIPGYDPQDLLDMLKASSDAAYQIFSEMLEALRALCEHLKEDNGKLGDKARAYFCYEGDENTLKHRRDDLYQYTNSMIRNYHAMPSEMQEKYRHELKLYVNLRDEIKRLSCEVNDENDIRQIIEMSSASIRQIMNDHLEAFKVTNAFSMHNLMGLTENTKPIDVVRDLIEKFKASNGNIEKEDMGLAADIIRNNIMAELRSRMDQDPVKYKKLSELLEEYLKKYEDAQKTFEDMVNDIQNDIVDKMDQPDENLPESILHADHPEACGALYKNLIENEIFVPEECEIVVVEIERIMLEEAQAEWRSNPAKRGNVEECIWRVLEVHGKANEGTLKLVMELIINQDVY